MDEAVDLHDPDLSPLGPNATVPPCPVGHPQGDLAASPYSPGGFSDADSADSHSAQPSSQSGYSDEGSDSGAENDGPAAAAQGQPASITRMYSSSAAEVAQPLPQQPEAPLGPDGRARLVRRGSTEVSRALRIPSTCSSKKAWPTDLLTLMQHLSRAQSTIVPDQQEDSCTEILSFIELQPVAQSAQFPASLS